MVDHDSPPASADRLDRFDQLVGRKAQRKQLARATSDRGAWFWLGMFGLVGWSIAVPTLIGIALGLWLDRAWPGRVSWTLTLLIVGVALGCWNAWRWIHRERPEEDAP